MRRRALLLAFVVLLPLLGATVAWAFMVRIQSQPAATKERWERSVITEELQRRVLRSVVVTRGNVLEVGSAEITLTGDVGELEGEPIYTGNVAAPGDVLRNGAVLAEISGRPVLAVEGVVPMYRTLLVGVKGDDVRQLEAYLSSVGLLTTSVDDEYDESTAEAVQAWYLTRGYEAVRSPVPEDARVPGQGRHSGLTEPGPAMIPRGELTFVPDLPRKVGVTRARVGSVPSGVAFALRGTRVEVRAQVDRRWGRVITKGGRAELIGPDIGLEADARVVGIAVHKSAGGQATVRLRSPEGLRPWIGANVAVRISLAATRGRVLVTSTAAIRTDEAGATFLEVVRDATPGAEVTERVDVDLGLTADALVEVVPIAGELRAGDRVVVSVR